MRGDVTPKGPKGIDLFGEHASIELGGGPWLDTEEYEKRANELKRRGVLCWLAYCCKKTEVLQEHDKYRGGMMLLKFYLLTR